MITFLRLLLWGCSALGYWEFLRRRMPDRPAFLPLTAAALQCCLLLAAGLLSLLQPAVYGLWGLGLVGLTYYTVSEKGKNLKYYFRAEFLFLVLGMGVLCFCLRGKVFTHFDNFSHWALVVKSMLRTGSLPDAESIISFQGYPLGSSVFVYATALLAGGGEPVQMLAQSYLMLCCMLPLFPPEGRSRRPAFLLLLFAGNFFLVYNIQPTELLVDSLLPLAGMSALLFALECKKADIRECISMSLLLVWVMQIKNAGIFFVLTAGGAFLIVARRQRRLPRGLACLGIALGSLLVWMLHCNLTFPSPESSAHFLSPAWWSRALQSKSTEDLKYIALEMGRRLLTWEYGGWWLAGLAAVCGYGFFFSKSHRRLLLPFALATVGFFLAYQVSLYLTYIFSMSRTEAFYLYSYERYEKTAILAVVYLLTALLTRLLPREGPVLSRLAPAALGSLALCLCLLPFGSSASVFDWRPFAFYNLDGLGARQWLEGLKAEYQIPDLSGDERYALLINTGHFDYYFFLGNYTFSGTGILVEINADQAVLDGLEAKYLLIQDTDNPDIQAWIQAHYPDQAGRPCIRLE